MYAYRPNVSEMKMGVGSLVYQVYPNGLRKGQQAGDHMGLVVGQLQESPTVVKQYQVEWFQGNLAGSKLWYYAHDLMEAK